MQQKTAPSLKIIFQVLHKIWYLNYLLPPLLNLKLHPTMTITQFQKIWIFNFYKRLLKNIKYFQRFKPI